MAHWASRRGGSAFPLACLIHRLTERLFKMTKLAILSDIHANLPALEAVIRYLAESCENVRDWRMISECYWGDSFIPKVSNSGGWQIEY